MNEPTKEQQQEVWERCGFRVKNLITGDGEIFGNSWFAPCGKRVRDLPPIDLNSLFKYAVPIVLEKLGKHKTVALVNKAVCDAVEAGGEIKDYLFWAIWGVFHAEIS